MDNEVHIQCAHNNSKLSSTSPPHKQLIVQFTSRTYQNIVYYNENNAAINTLLVSRHQYPCSSVTKYIKPINPFCGLCRSEIVGTLLKHGYDNPEDINLEFRCLAKEVQRQLVTMRDNVDQNNVEYFHYQLRIEAPARVVDEEDYMKLVADGVVFDEVEVEPMEDGSVPASESAIERLERVVIDEEKIDKKNVCAICLEELIVKKEQEIDGDNMEQETKDDDCLVNKFTILRLPCKHVFHEGCVTIWLRNNHVCPCCRFELPVD